jgi:NADH:ubiquinone oxidoreductase subunit 6 (subunit J)
LTFVVCLALAGWSLWVRIPAAIYAVYLGALAVLILSWGMSFERDFHRVIVGATLGAVSATLVAFFGMLLPNAEHRKQCAEPGMYCEDLTGALLLYGAPIVFLSVPLLVAAVHATTLAIGAAARYVARARRG